MFWITVSIAVLAAMMALLVFLLIRLRRDQLFMAQQKCCVTGTVTDVKPFRAGGTVSDRVTFCYSVAGTEYTRVCSCRPQRFHRDQTVQMICHPDKPKMAFPECLFRVMPVSALRLAAGFCAAVPVLVLCFAVGGMNEAWSRYFDHFQYPLSLLYIWGSYWLEYRIVRRGKSGTGTIVYSERDDKTVRAAAEFTVGGITYETRVMQMPARRCTREYVQGGQIGVLYREESPDESVIEDDTRKEKLWRLLAIIGSIVLPSLWVLSLL
ncbi:MAG: hypothetical protein J6Z45_04325 [Oscillospiraceae bacterium]|nr:hypothetical protein [Oscillospiraceae bacterium]